MRLLVDVGNTRIKWAVLAAGEMHSGGHWPSRDVAGLREVWLARPFWESRAGAAPHLLSRPAAVAPVAVVACVAGETLRAEIARLLGEIGLVTYWVAPGWTGHGLINRYHPPESLGVDRYVAMIGALKRFGRDCVVVNVGTAMTADMLRAGGEFLGGCIVPGPDMMRASLLSGTAGVRPGSGGWRDFPLDTGAAVETGISLALLGVVQGMRERLAREEKEGVMMALPAVILGGGARACLRPLLPGEVIEMDELVLEGLSWIARDMECAG